jgi:hypothetical protein
MSRGAEAKYEEVDFVRGPGGKLWWSMRREAAVKIDEGGLVLDEDGGRGGG